MTSAISLDDFLKAAIDFEQKSHLVRDGWLFEYNEMDESKSYLRQDLYVIVASGRIMKAVNVIFYHMSYGVPVFSFNMWNPSGSLVTLEEIRSMPLTCLKQKDFYSVITQQEHPIFNRPYYMVHPCHTEEVLALFKDTTKNIIVTFFSIVSPLLRSELSMEYGM